MATYIDAVEGKHTDGSEQEVGNGARYCPKCGEALEYGSGESVDGFYRHKCNCSECGFSGYEWYAMKFDGFTGF